MWVGEGIPFLSKPRWWRGSPAAARCLYSLHSFLMKWAWWEGRWTRLTLPFTRAWCITSLWASFSSSSITGSQLEAIALQGTFGNVWRHCLIVTTWDGGATSISWVEEGAAKPSAMYPRQRRIQPQMTVVVGLRRPALSEEDGRYTL